MRRSVCLPVLWAVLAAAAPVLAVAETADEDLLVNRRLLEKWRRDPEHYARLKRDYKALQNLPTEKRERLRELDRDLRDEDIDTQARLRRVMDRFMEWLDRLPEVDRARIEAAEDGSDRLRVVKEIREREWIKHLPRVDQEQVNKPAPVDQRAKLIAELRQEERNRRREWQTAMLNIDDPASRAQKPERLDEFPPLTQLYYLKTLRFMLSQNEADSVRRADGQWPDLARTLFELSQKHSEVKVPPGKWEGPKSFEAMRPDEIPKELRGFLEFKRPKDFGPGNPDSKLVRRLQMSRGKWPDFALALHDVAEAKGAKFSKPLGPCTLNDLHPAVVKFFRETLGPELKKEEHREDWKKLEEAQGKWPEYPQLFMDLAKKYRMKVPGTFLGGDPEMWKNAKGG